MSAAKAAKKPAQYVAVAASGAPRQEATDDADAPATDIAGIDAPPVPASEHEAA